MYVHKLAIYDCILYFLISIIISSGTVSTVSIWYTSCTRLLSSVAGHHGHSSSNIEVNRHTGGVA